MHALHSASMQIHDVLTHQDMVPMAIGVARDAAVSREGRVVCRVAEACMQGLHEAGYNIITVGHSLGAGAAALLAMMLKSRRDNFDLCFNPNMDMSSALCAHPCLQKFQISTASEGKHSRRKVPS